MRPISVAKFSLLDALCVWVCYQHIRPGPYLCSQKVTEERDVAASLYVMRFYGQAFDSLKGKGKKNPVLLSLTKEPGRLVIARVEVVTSSCPCRLGRVGTNETSTVEWQQRLAVPHLQSSTPGPRYSSGPADTAVTVLQVQLILNSGA